MRVSRATQLIDDALAASELDSYGNGTKRGSSATQFQPNASRLPDIEGD
jgi:hypothetical protein